MSVWNPRLGVRGWLCPKCGIIHGRDVNGAQNISARFAKYTMGHMEIYTGGVCAGLSNFRNSTVIDIQPGIPYLRAWVVAKQHGSKNCKNTDK
jgi:hypothetical protein